ncbi:MAG: family 10 glycosylhydrolase [Kiritimatiellae bacterium]|nr:family 10 glycosylhydrolase [Kiritimatiellia bacterium]
MFGRFLSMKRHGIFAGIIIIFATCCSSVAMELPLLSKEDYRVVLNLNYENAKAARGAWRPMAGSLPVSLAKAGKRNVLDLHCNFSGTTIKRASWDADVKLDLSSCQGLKFRFFCADSAPVAQFNVYLRSGKGWYTKSFDGVDRGEWTTVTLDKAEMSTEGETAGWTKIDRIRISAWRASDKNTIFSIADLGLFGGNSSIVVIRADSIQRSRPKDARAVTRYTKNVVRYLRSLDVSYDIVSDIDIRPEGLSKKKIVILPYNPDMPSGVVDEIRRFLKKGGGLVCFYLFPPELLGVTGISCGKHMKQEYKGQFAAICSADGTLPGMPRVLTQKSWNIYQAKPVKGRSKTIAYWHDEAGKNVGEPAVIMSDNCIFVTTVFLSGDPANKKKMMLAMMGRFMPELWKEAAAKAVAGIGRFGGYRDAAEVKKAVSTMRRRDRRLAGLLKDAESFGASAELFAGKGNYVKAVDRAEKAKEALVRAYCSVQESEKNEYRAFWCHSPFGVSGMNWNESVKRLAENGFTAIIPSMLWSGAAYYESRVLSVAPEVKTKGDQVSQCVSACKEYGLDCHVWKICWNMGSRDIGGFPEKMKKAGRIQISSSGKPLDRWLCPSHPANRKLEVESLLEVVTGYGVTGIHLDYIRYPGEDYCFCGGCRGRFEKVIGRKIKNWPADARDGKLRGRWLEFRRDNITSLVAEISKKARLVKPGIKISAAVFPNWTSARDNIGQDWKTWCDKRYVDFVCPMNYRASKSWFENTVAQQKVWSGKTPCYPGIGLSTWTTGDSISLLLDQIKITRRLQMNGFVIFKYGASEARDIVPLCGLGITDRD